MAKRVTKKSENTLTSSDAKELRDEMGSLGDAFQQLLSQNTKLVTGISELNKNIFKLAGKEEKKKKEKDPSKGVEEKYKQNIDKMFKGITGKFGDNIDKLFGGKVKKGLQAFAKNLDEKAKAGGVKGAFSGTGYYDPKTGKQLSFKGKIPKGSKQITSKKQHAELFGQGGKFGAGKNAAGGMLQKAGGTLMRGAAGLLRAAGPIAAAFSIGMQVVDFFNSGKAAQAAADIGAILGKDTTEQTKAAFMVSKKYREIQADFNIIKPVERENQKRMDMLEFQKSAEMDRVGFSQQLVKDEYNRRFENEKDWLNFAHSQAMANVDAEHERRKTLFMTGMKSFQKYISVSERALNAIGSSAEAVINAISSVGKNLGASVPNMLKMSTAAAGVSKLLGSSAEDVLNMGNMFRLMNKTTLQVGTNLTTGIKAFADKNGVMASVIMKDMVDASAEVYKFSDGTAENFAKQAVALNKMGTSMNAMMKASDAMVLNYKDSIKAEMSLSAMLGRNVDLSETRAKLMAGDQAGAAESLRTALGGQDVGAMNAFQKQQLSQATGMDIEQLMSLQQGGEGGVEGTLEQKNAEKTGRDIANGALKQDISNEAAKIAMEQAFRAKMLKFEQDERKGMLMIEQMQRLENLAIEQRWRIRFAEAEKKGTLDTEIAKMQAEASTKMLANMFNDAAGSYREALNKDASLTEQQITGKFQAFQAQNQEAQSYLNELILQGVVNSEAAQGTIIDISQGIAKGQTFSTEQINQMLVDEGAFQKAIQTTNENLAKKQEELAAAQAVAEEKSLSWWESGLASVGSLLSTVTGDDDFFGYGSADIIAEKESADALNNIKASMEGMNKNTEAYSDVIAKYTPQIETGVLNDDMRGKIFQKQYEHQASISDANVTATYAVLFGIEKLAAAQGKPIVIDGNGVRSTINRLDGRNYVSAM